jgi:hypothetical protein
VNSLFAIGNVERKCKVMAKEIGGRGISAAYFLFGGGIENGKMTAHKGRTFFEDGLFLEICVTF